MLSWSPSGSKTGSGSVSGSRRQPKESRRWLKRPLPRAQLYRMAPRRKPVRLGRSEAWDWTRRLIRTWWIWLALALTAHYTDHGILMVVAGIVAFVFYNTTPELHPAVYALETSLAV